MLEKSSNSYIKNIWVASAALYFLRGSMNRIENEVTSLLTSKLNSLGYELVRVQFQKESGEYYLRITIDKDEDISLDAIVEVSDLISPLLDASDIIKDKYILDVTSLGAEKAIKINRLDKYVNRYLNLHLSHPYKGLNNIVGTLKKVDVNSVTIEIQDKARKKEIILNRADIDKANLAIKF